MVFTNTDVDNIHASYAKQLTEQDERISELEAENRRMREALLNAQTAIDGYHAVTGSLDMGLAEAARQAERVLNAARAALSQEDKP